MQNAATQHIKEAKLSVVMLDETLSWSCHINNVVSKMSRKHNEQYKKHLSDE